MTVPLVTVPLTTVRQMAGGSSSGALDSAWHSATASGGASPDPAAPQIGVLALQGSFDLHVAMLRRLGAATRKVREPRELDGLDALVIPGGESTVMTGISSEVGLFEALREAGRGGLPMLGTCAGAILLGCGEEAPARLELVPLVVRRNAYGRQRESFSREVLLTPFEAPFRAVFIRAPRIELPSSPASLGVDVLGVVGDDPVLVRHGRFLLSTFHPELTSDPRVHAWFLDELVGASRRGGDGAR